MLSKKLFSILIAAFTCVSAGAIDIMDEGEAVTIREELTTEYSFPPKSIIPIECRTHILFNMIRLEE